MKALSILLTLCMVLQYVPTTAFAAATDNLCEHHTVHSQEVCGYVEAVAGSDCTHVHDELCGYTEAVAEVLCDCEAAEDGTLTHAEGCGYVAPMAGSDCAHAHGDCGYAAPVEAKPCTYHCDICLGHDHGEEEEEEQETTAPSSEANEPSSKATEPAPVCNCGTDDETIHATTCAVYVAPENPVCYCAEKCTEVNEWCDVCGFDTTKCTGTGEAVTYQEADGCQAHVNITVEGDATAKANGGVYAEVFVHLIGFGYVALKGADEDNREDMVDGTIHIPYPSGYPLCTFVLHPIAVEGYSVTMTGADEGTYYEQQYPTSVTVTYTSTQVADEYSVTVDPAEHGTVTADKTTAAQDETVTLTVTPAKGYMVDTVTCNGTAITPVEGVYSFIMPASAVAVSATFKVCDHTGAVVEYVYSSVENHMLKCSICNIDDIYQKHTFSNNVCTACDARTIFVDMEAARVSSGSLAKEGSERWLVYDADDANNKYLGYTVLPGDYSGTVTWSYTAPNTGYTYTSEPTTVPADKNCLRLVEKVDDVYTVLWHNHPHEHTYSSQTGICTECKQECKHEWNASVCSVCSYACPHSSHDNYHKCTDCDFQFAHEFDKYGDCSDSICSETCDHLNLDEEVVCIDCGMYKVNLFSNYYMSDPSVYIVGKKDLGEMETVIYNEHYTCFLPVGEDIIQFYSGSPIWYSEEFTYDGTYNALRMIAYNNEDDTIKLKKFNYPCEHDGNENSFIDDRNGATHSMNCSVCGEEFISNHEMNAETGMCEVCGARTIYVDMAVASNVQGSYLTGENGERWYISMVADADNNQLGCAVLPGDYSGTVTWSSGFSYSSETTVVPADKNCLRLVEKGDGVYTVVWHNHPHEHTYSSQTGACTQCLLKCKHIWNEDSICSACSYACPHSSYTVFHMCQDCRFQIPHEFDKYGNCSDSICTETCDHLNLDEEGVCTDCSMHKIYLFIDGNMSNPFIQFVDTSITERMMPETSEDLYSGFLPVGEDVLCFTSNSNNSVEFTYDGTYNAFRAIGINDDGTVNLKTFNHPCEHSYTYTNEDGTTHKKVCSICGVVVAVEVHTGGTATCTEKAKCDKCGAEYGEILSHQMDSSTGLCGNGCEKLMAQASVTMGGTTTYYEKLEDAIDDVSAATAEDAAEVTLLKSVEQEQRIGSDAGVFTLDLNGKTLGGEAVYCPLEINNATVTITDNQGSGEIIGETYGVSASGGTVNIKNVAITATGTNGRGVYASVGILTITNATITATGEYSVGVYAYKGVEVTVKSSAIHSKYRGLYTYGCANATVEGGTIKVTGEYGNGVTADGSTLTIKDAEITSTGEYSNGVYAYNGAEVTIEDGTIEGYNGVSVIGSDSTVAITDATITASSDDGYGVEVSEGAKATIKGGIINRVYDINCQNSIVTLQLGEDGTGTSFPSGIRVNGILLEDILGEGAAYWQDGKMIILEEGQIPINGGTVTVEAECKHSGNTNETYTDNGDGTHSFTCSVCGTEVTEAHTGSTATCEAKAKCENCGADYGNLAAHTPGYTASGNTITETCEVCKTVTGTAAIFAEDVTYTGDAYTGAYTEYHWMGDEPTIHYNTDDGFAPVNAGDYTAYISYGDVTASDTFTISPKNIANCTVTLSKNSFVYSGKAPSLNVSVVDNGVGSTQLKEDTDYTVGTAEINAGDHKLTITGKGNYTGTVELDYTITAKEVSIGTTTIKDVTYNAAGYDLEVTNVTFNGVLDGETLEYTASAELKGTNAIGTQGTEVTVTLNNSNYVLEQATVLGKVTINKANQADLMITGKQDSPAYGDSFTLGTSGGTTNGAVTWAASGTASVDESGKVTITGVGSFTITATMAGSDNYNDVTAAWTGISVKADPDIGNVTYDGETLYDSTAVSEVVLTRTNMTVAGVLYLTDSQLTAGEGTYHWTFTPVDTENYNIITGTVTLKVTADAVEAIEASGKLEKKEFVYGDTFSIDGLTITATYTSGATKDVTKLVSFDSTLAVGQTSVELRYQGKTCVVSGITVARKQLVVSGMSWTVPTDAVYSGIAYTATLTGELPEGVKVDVSGNTGTNAGNYTAKAVFSLAEGFSAENYEIVNGEDLTAAWSIAKKDIDGATITLGTALTYNGEQQTQTVAEVKVGDVVVDDYTVSDNTGTDANDYTLSIAGKGNFEGTATADWSIAKKNISGAAITLGDSLTYNGNEQTQTVTNVKIGDLTVTYDVTATKQLGAGNYTLTVTGNGNFEGTATADWSIAKAALTVTAKDNSITYGDAPANDGVSYTGFVSNENEAVLGGTLAYSYNYQQYGNVGTYKITPAGLTSDNYEITFADGTLTVTAKTITVKAEAKSKIYGDADPALTYTATGLVNGDKLSGALSREAGTDVGTYAITQGALTAGSNYTIAFHGAELTINAKAITKADVEMNGSLTYTGEQQTQEVTVTEGVTYEVSGNKATNVGTYELTVKGTENYTGKIKLSWSIKEAAAVITTAPVANTLTYNGSAQELVTEGTTADGIMLYSLDGEHWNGSIPAGKDAGDYTVWFYVQGDENHADSEPASFSVTIKKAAADYEAPTANTLTYNGNTQALVTEGTAANGTMMYKLGENGTYSATVPSAEDADTYTVYYYVKGDSNHEDSAVQKIVATIGQLDITGKTVDITLADTLTYNGAEQVVGVSSAKLGELTVTYTVSGNTGTNATDYTLTITGNGNFKGTATKEWSISKKSVMVTAKDQSITYGESISGTEITATGLVDGHSTTMTLTPGTVNVTVSGTITASAAVITDAGTDVTANYNVSYTSGKLVIKPDTSKIDALTTDNVTSANEEDIKAVQAMMASADSVKDEWAAITATCEDLIEKIQAVEAENARIADVAADFDLNTVKSSDEAAIAALIADIDEQLAADNLTDEERSELESLKTKCNNLIAKIDGTETLIDQLDKTVDDLDAETVKSTDKAALEQVIADAGTLIDSGNINETEKEALREIQEDAKALIKVIDDTAAENKALTERAATFDEDAVKSTDKTTLEQLAQDIEDLLDAQKLTEDERTALGAVLEQVAGMIDTINETAEDSKAATDAIDALDPATVTSGDKDELEQAIAIIDELLKDDHLTEDERKALEDAKADAEALIERIEAAKDATDTENTEKVEDVTAENVGIEDKEALEDAKADLEKALEDNAGNYTEEEKKTIQDEIQRIDDAVTALENVEDVTDSITQLPETVEPDDEEAAEKILDAKKSYDELTDHEKSLVDETTKKKLDDLAAALTAYDIIKGDEGKWTKGSDGSLSFTANGSFSKFVSIEVDGKKVDAKYYDAKAGSTIITLKQSFLKSLSTGEHTITVLYTDGETSGTFKILAESSTPGTGDNSNIMLWSGMLCVSTLCLAVLLADRKRRTTK